MKRDFQIFFRNGNLTFIAAFLFVALGFLVMYIAVKYAPTSSLKILGLSIGLAIAAVGGFSGRAKALDLKPFSSDPLDWRTAKKTYSKDVERANSES